MTSRVDTSTPIRLTRRGEAALAVVVVLAIAAALVLAYVLGQDRRCRSLRADHSPLTAQYCPPATDRQEPTVR